MADDTTRTHRVRSDANNSKLLRQQQIVRLKAFSTLKEKQSQTLAAAAGEKISPEFHRYFDAAAKGDWQTVTNMYGKFQETASAVQEQTRTYRHESADELLVTHTRNLAGLRLYRQLRAQIHADIG